MFEYKFEKVLLGEPRFGFKDSRPLDDYHEIIHEHAREGWRLVQIFSPSIDNHKGTATYFELIFERKVD
ncbi:DUF4177 domain-containing protein [Oceanobacillus luteolus]|uniref:DUF4177 domain-containing protein n=1 Tax=Oceanobacillus luteolus TaxID=1274358 RepID=UPI00203CE930|nr:DUF4177 domain-containing protein [Oceanobacillus luteolus]MCM3740289.1 DUF4177 domain-containing protein [Oceanobacillus luteolus]